MQIQSMSKMLNPLEGLKSMVGGAMDAMKGIGNALGSLMNRDIGGAMKGLSEAMKGMADVAMNATPMGKMGLAQPFMDKMFDMLGGGAKGAGEQGAGAAPGAQGAGNEAKSGGLAEMLAALFGDKAGAAGDAGPAKGAAPSAGPAKGGEASPDTAQAAPESPMSTLQDSLMQGMATQLVQGAMQQAVQQAQQQQAAMQQAMQGAMQGALLQGLMQGLSPEAPADAKGNTTEIKPG
jgi:hypothetical protein